MTTNAQGLATRLANVTRALARARLRLIGMGQAGVLLRADVQLYEITRRKLVGVGTQLTAQRRITTQLYVPAPVPEATVALAQVGTPSATVMIRAAAQAGRLQGIQQANPVTDEGEAALAGIEREVQTVVQYVTEREYDTGLAEPAQQPGLDQVYAALTSPRVLGALSLGASLLVSTIAMASSTNQQGDPLTVLQQGMTLAKDLLKSAQPVPEQPRVVEARVIESVQCPRPEKQPEPVVVEVQEAKEA